VGVCNDVHLDAAHRLLIVSGSNMSGKSTLLRTVGLNAVLALCGAPVRARSLMLSPLRVGATLCIQDSLHSGTSRFYAELKRLRQLKEATAGPVPLLFLLDEILHGTNSHDRAVGAAALLQSLLGSNAIGLVTTHDLSLSQKAEVLQARNVHFADDWVDGALRFDYRMRDGVVQKSNALALMQQAGLL
jgi:DNA mismatch repair ATPase MutS